MYRTMELGQVLRVVAPWALGLAIVLSLGSLVLTIRFLRWVRLQSKGDDRDGDKTN